MFAFLGILFVYMALPLGHAKVDAVGGVMDLRGSDLSKAVYQLTGEWQITQRLFVEPSEFPEEAPVVLIPEKWARSHDELNTYATYRLTIYTDETRLLTMFIPEIYTAYKLWINGEYIRGAGVVADNQADGSPEFEGVGVPLKAADGKVEIVIQASNFHYMRPIMNSLILLGENDSAYAWFFRTRSLYIMALGVFLAGAFYHIALYALRRKESVYLMFSVLSLICFWLYAIDTNGLSNIAGWFSMSGGLADLKVFMALFFLHGAAIAAFSLYVFDRAWVMKYRVWVVGYTVIGAVLFAAMSWNTHRAAVIVMSAMLPAIILAIYIAARSRKLREDKMMWLNFAALVLYAIVSVVQKYWLDHLFYMTGMITDLLLLMTQALILSRQFADIQESERLLGEKNEMLDRINRMRTEFFQNMSHDFKTPLTVIQANVMDADDMLDFELNKNEMRGSLAVAQREVMYLARMVDNALKYSAMQDNRQEMEPLDISRLLREGASTFRPLLERQGNTLTLDVPLSLPRIIGSTDTLLHVLSNIISNSNRHTRAGDISIRAIENNNSIVITVQDNGAGIKPEMLPYIFERGVSDSGTGLGLSICATAIEAHGGTIDIKSEYGQGVTVTIALPIHDDLGCGGMGI